MNFRISRVSKLFSARLARDSRQPSPLDRRPMSCGKVFRSHNLVLELIGYNTLKNNIKHPKPLHHIH